MNVMLSDTLTEGLEAYRIGAKIKALRTGKNLGLAQLGDHTGMSAGMLSKIERGTVFPTLPTLLKIAMVFGVGLDHFFTEGDKPVLEIVRKRDRVRLPNTTQSRPTFTFESLDFPVNDRPTEAFLAEFQPRAPATDPHEHGGLEFVYVISGSIEIQIHNDTHVLGTGDSMYFDPRYPHLYRCEGSERANVIVVVVATPS